MQLYEDVLVGIIAGIQSKPIEYHEFRKLSVIDFLA